MQDEDRSGDAVWSFRTVSKWHYSLTCRSRTKLIKAAKVKKQPRGVCLVSFFKIGRAETLLSLDYQSLGEHNYSMRKI